MKLNWRYFVKMAEQLVESGFFRTVQGRVMREGRVVRVRTKKGKLWVTLTYKRRTYVYLYQTRDTWVFRGVSGNILLKRKREQEIPTSCTFTLTKPFPTSGQDKKETKPVLFERVHGY